MKSAAMPLSRPVGREVKAARSSAFELSPGDDEAGKEQDDASSRTGRGWQGQLEGADGVRGELAIEVSVALEGHVESDKEIVQEGVLPVSREGAGIVCGEEAQGAGRNPEEVTPCVRGDVPQAEVQHGVDKEGEDGLGS